MCHRCLLLFVLSVIITTLQTKLCQGFLTRQRRKLLQQKTQVFPLGRHCYQSFTCSSSAAFDRKNYRLFGVVLRNRPDKAGENEEEESADDDIGVERERKRLESLLGTPSSQDKEKNDSLLSLPISEWKKQLKDAPPLTAIGRERIETEISLLESLAHSDDAIK